MSIQTCGATALRVVQLDSAILDNEIINYFESQVEQIISTLPVSVSVYWQRYSDEFKVGLSAVLWSYRLFKGYSPGQQMMNIAYRQYSPKSATIHFIVAVIIPYIVSKAPRRITDPKVKQFLQQIVGAAKLLSFLHHLFFLRFGGPVSLWERLLQLKPEYLTPPTLGLISYTSLNRELLWHSYRDLLLLLLPLGRLSRQLWTRWRSRRQLCMSVVSGVDPMKLEMKPFLPLKCARCDQPAVVPVRNAEAETFDHCGHVFCLYCYDCKVECPKCGLWLAKGKETMIRGLVNHLR
uniref:RING-type E3 ubiquitin transferase (cysteine targeting) n=1 Tax=Panagrellus redivivus TaxID=6233 RepID=A0A7E4W1I4_PANRE